MLYDAGWQKVKRINKCILKFSLFSTVRLFAQCWCLPVYLGLQCNLTPAISPFSLFSLQGAQVPLSVL